MAEECVFCDIVAGKFGTKFLYEDDLCVAFADLKPTAPVHLLVVPRKHYPNLQSAAAEEATLGRLLAVAGKVVKDGDFRVVVNNGADAGQTVYHLHLHVLAGRHFGWPPG
jgi:histidine triad (HIT) family protein